MVPFRRLNPWLQKRRNAVPVRSFKQQSVSPHDSQKNRLKRSSSIRVRVGRVSLPGLLKLVLLLLALPGVGSFFWLGAGWLDQQVLGQPDQPPEQIILPNPQQIELVLRLTVVSIDVEINRQGGTSEVTAQVRGSTLRELEFEYPLTDYSELESAISQELNLLPEQTRQLIRYRLD